MRVQSHAPFIDLSAELADAVREAREALARAGQRRLETFRLSTELSRSAASAEASFSLASGVLSAGRGVGDACQRVDLVRAAAQTPGPTPSAAASSAPRDPASTGEPIEPATSATSDPEHALALPRRAASELAATAAASKETSSAAARAAAMQEEDAQALRLERAQLRDLARA